MLILSRKVGDSVTIGDDITVKVLSTRGSQVRLAVQAPNQIPVHREEIYYKIQHEQSQNDH